MTIRNHTNGATVIDPDAAAGPVWEVPVTDPSTLETVDFPNPPPVPSPAGG